VKLTREQIDALIYGGPGESRFTQDSPILPDVWIRYVEQPAGRHELLLTPYQDPKEGRTPAGRLAKALRMQLERYHRRAGIHRDEGQARDAEVAYNVTTVVARLTFLELVRVVLPLSFWWKDRVDESVQRVLDQVRDPRGQELAVSVLLDPLGGRGRQSPDVLWMAQVIGTIEYARTHERAPYEGWPPLLDPDGVTGERRRAYYQDIVRALGELLQYREVPDDPPARVWSVSLNRAARATVWRSRATVKADAAGRVFDVSCRDLAWAVLDSGIDARHPAFRQRDEKHDPYAQPFEDGRNRTRVIATYDFTGVKDLLRVDTLDPDTPDEALPDGIRAKLTTDAGRKIRARLFENFDEGRELDWDLIASLIQVPHGDDRRPVHERYEPPVHEHGTHVAGILAGDWDRDYRGRNPAGALQGICPDLRLYDLRVLDQRGEGEEFNIMAALQFVRHLNSSSDVMAVHGVNVSVSIRHDIANFACGRTPVCEECERLVGAGIVVVAAAGNDGYLQYLTSRGPQDSYRSISITDPGNAEGVITVGSTHRFQPHTYGVSYFSSRGPTGDGRAKPDLVAPGEKIEGPVPNEGSKVMDGTSMAAPHVSGAAALLLARHRELIGQPARVKKILCTTATDLGRERYFQGAGLVDILRALQSV
jgi:serine protease AprX